MPTKQEERAANAKRREELVSGDRQQISHSNDIDYPATAPAKKAEADRIARDKDNAYAKPFPVESNLTATASAAEPNPQSPAEFKETGGVKVTDDSKTAQENSSGTEEVAKDPAAADNKDAAKTADKTTAKAETKPATTPKK